ncbi:hypothetical protein SDC9_47770 [bioreactor metagenome]|uniref:Uncharacterized protein n=1 Tax=bioreactor metagenome TaxID=1076179 RepID=A0A644WCK9_9ZZZZ
MVGIPDPGDPEVLHLNALAVEHEIEGQGRQSAGIGGHVPVVGVPEQPLAEEGAELFLAGVHVTVTGENDGLLRLAAPFRHFADLDFPRSVPQGKMGQEEGKRLKLDLEEGPLDPPAQVVLPGRENRQPGHHGVPLGFQQGGPGDERLVVVLAGKNGLGFQPGRHEFRLAFAVLPVGARVSLHKPHDVGLQLRYKVGDPPEPSLGFPETAGKGEGKMVVPSRTGPVADVVEYKSHADPPGKEIISDYTAKRGSFIGFSACFSGSRPRNRSFQPPFCHIEQLPWQVAFLEFRDLLQGKPVSEQGHGLTVKETDGVPVKLPYVLRPASPLSPVGIPLVPHCVDVQPPGDKNPPDLRGKKEKLLQRQGHAEQHVGIASVEGTVFEGEDFPCIRLRCTDP